MSEYRIAKEDLFIGRARAHQKGDRVPVDNVERNGWQDKVVGENTKTAAKVVKDS